MYKKFQKLYMTKASCKNPNSQPPPLWYTGGKGASMEQKTFSRLLVVKIHHKDKSYNKYWECQCACGLQTVVREDKLKQGKIKSCGCLAAERVQALQCIAQEEDRVYTKSSYMSMIQRCTNPNLKSFAAYGGRGITVCDRWVNGDGIRNGWTCFFEDMGPRPRNKTIDRLDNSKGYSPDNCRWATWHEQSVNRSTTKFTDVQIHQIRNSPTTRKQAAAEFNTSKDYIKKIRAKKVWGSI